MTVSLGFLAEKNFKNFREDRIRNSMTKMFIETTKNAHDNVQILDNDNT